MGQTCCKSFSTDEKSTLVSKSKEDRANADIDISPGNFVNLKTFVEISKQYEFFDEIAAGSFGHVIRVKFKSTGEYRAMKVIKKSLIKGNKQIDLLYEEVNTLKSLVLLLLSPIQI